MSSIVCHIPSWSVYYKIYHTYEYGCMYTSVYSILYSYKINSKTKPINLLPKLWNYTLPLTLRTHVCPSWFHHLSPPLRRFNNNSNFLLIILLFFFLVLCIIQKYLYVFFSDFELKYLLYVVWDFLFLLSTIFELIHISMISFSIIHQHLSTLEYNYLSYCWWTFGLLTFFALTRLLRMILHISSGVYIYKS